MNSLTELKCNWEETKDRLKQDFALINDNDLLFTEGRQDELIDRLQVKLGKTREEVHSKLSSANNRPLSAAPISVAPADFSI